MIAAVGFYPQPNDWTCGPFALKHALVTLGRIVDEDQVSAHTRTHWWSGTDEIRLARAARAFDCDLKLVRTRDAERARTLLRGELRNRNPVILCVDGWEHWITAVRYEAGRFVLIDSNLDPVLDSLAWPQLMSRWGYHDEDYDPEDPPVIFDYFSVRPRYRTQVKADFSLARLRHLRRPENRRVAEYWNQYLEDLLEICRPPSARFVEPLSMGEFLRRNQDLIISRVVYWHGDVDRQVVVRLLKDFRFVAETYGLIIPAASRRRAVADIAILATMAVVAINGVGDIYGLGD